MGAALHGRACGHLRQVPPRAAAPSDEARRRPRVSDDGEDHARRLCAAKSTATTDSRAVGAALRVLCSCLKNRFAPCRADRNWQLAILSSPLSGRQPWAMHPYLLHETALLRAQHRIMVHETLLLLIRMPRSLLRTRRRSSIHETSIGIWLLPRPRRYPLRRLRRRRPLETEAPMLLRKFDPVCFHCSFLLMMIRQ